MGIEDLIKHTHVSWGGNVSWKRRREYSKKFSEILKQRPVRWSWFWSPERKFIAENLMRIAEESPDFFGEIEKSMLPKMIEKNKRLEIELHDSEVGTKDRKNTSWLGTEENPFKININLRDFKKDTDHITKKVNFWSKKYQLLGTVNVDEKTFYKAGSGYSPFHTTLVHELGHIDDWSSEARNIPKEYVDKKKKKLLSLAKEEHYSIVKRHRRGIGESMKFEYGFPNVGEAKNIIGGGKKVRGSSENEFRMKAGYHIRVSHMKPEDDNFFLLEEDDVVDFIPPSMRSEWRVKLPKNYTSPPLISKNEIFHNEHAVAFTPMKTLKGMDPHQYELSKEQFHKNDARNVYQIGVAIAGEENMKLNTTKAEQFKNAVTEIYNTRSKNLNSEKYSGILLPETVYRVKQEKRKMKFNIFVNNMRVAYPKAQPIA